MQLTSPAFEHNATLPTDYTCKGRGVNPPLSISDVPPGTKSLAIIAHDPDTPTGRDFLHWSVWNIDPGTLGIAESKLPTGVVQGTNDYPDQGYGPACPPPWSGLHHYVFDLYALDTAPDLPPGASRTQLESAMKDHILATAQLVGTIQA